MGTASLVIGIGLIIAGLYIIFFDPYEPVDEYEVLGILIIGIPIIAIGALFLRKYDKDKKKESVK